MTKKSEITQKDFNKLLNWLDEDKQVAAEKYKSIHHRLVQIFSSRDAFPADELADKTIDRAIQKIDYLIEEYQGEPALYFYAVANKIFLEHLRKPKTEPLSDNLLETEWEDENKSFYECLNRCLHTLLPEQRELIVEYFQYEKQTKADHHKRMAQKLGLDVNAIRTRVYRIRISMEKCVEKCVRKKIM